MQRLLKPLHTESLKDTFIKRFEELILSGAFPIGQRLPSERELALQLNVSRPVVHEGLVDLAAKGLVTLTPRVGTMVNDYRKEGSLALLTSLVNYHQGNLELGLLNSLLDMRLLFEVETARLAARHRTADQLKSFRGLLQKEAAVDHLNSAEISELDFDFHHLLALSSGNNIYPLLLNSFKECYLNLAGQFFSDPGVVPEVFAFHQEMVVALTDKNERKAARIMRGMLEHGAEHLKINSERTQRPQHPCSQ
ncbi:MAG: FadR family transcriptional regulator [Deltaproteobacteria bacterium]|nr:FadR family transcriptional regulator [Deltaproteobacteria bacterium]